MPDPDASNPLLPAPTLAEQYLAVIQAAIYRAPDEGDIPAYAASAAAFIATRPQPYDAYDHPLMPHERVMAFGIRQERGDCFILCLLERHRGHWRTTREIGVYSTLRGAQASLESASGVIVDLMCCEGETPLSATQWYRHYLAVPRAKMYQ